MAIVPPHRRHGGFRPKLAVEAWWLSSRCLRSCDPPVTPTPKIAIARVARPEF